MTVNVNWSPLWRGVGSGFGLAAQVAPAGRPVQVTSGFWMNGISIRLRVIVVNPEDPAVTVMVLGFAESEALGGGTMVRLPVPELGALPESPGYEARTVGFPTLAPLTVTEQLVPERLQIFPEGNVTAPVPADWLQLIVSPEIVPDAPVTVAVQELDKPTLIVEGEQLTVVVVADRTVKFTQLLRSVMPSALY